MLFQEQIQSYIMENLLSPNEPRNEKELNSIMLKNNTVWTYPVIDNYLTPSQWRRSYPGESSNKKCIDVKTCETKSINKNIHYALVKSKLSRKNNRSRFHETISEIKLQKTPKTHKYHRRITLFKNQELHCLKKIIYIYIYHNFNIRTYSFTQDAPFTYSNKPMTQYWCNNLTHYKTKILSLTIWKVSCPDCPVNLMHNDRHRARQDRHVNASTEHTSCLFASAALVVIPCGSFSENVAIFVTWPFVTCSYERGLRLIFMTFDILTDYKKVHKMQFNLIFKLRLYLKKIEKLKCGESSGGHSDSPLLCQQLISAPATEGPFCLFVSLLNV